jgi:hypothetical protein
MAAASAMIALRATDGSAPLTTITPTSTQPGDYQLTTGCPSGMFYNWQNVTPFGISAAADFLLSPPPDLTSNRYSKDYLEVKTVGSATSADRSEDRAEVVRPMQVRHQASCWHGNAAIAAAKGTSLSETRERSP